MAKSKKFKDEKPDPAVDAYYKERREGRADYIDGYTDALQGG